MLAMVVRLATRRVEGKDLKTEDCRQVGIGTQIYELRMNQKIEHE